MRCQLAIFLAALTQGYASFQATEMIQWQSSSGDPYVLAPESSPTGQRLTIRDFPSARYAKFTVNNDETIQLDGWCVEASGNAVIVNHCTGGQAQKWNWVRNGRGGQLIQLKDTNQCIGVSDTEGVLSGRPVELQKCDDKAAELWKFAAPETIATQDASSMGYATMYFVVLAVLSGLGLSSFLWRWNATARTVARSNGALLNTEQAGTTMTDWTVMKPSARTSTPRMSLAEDSGAASQATTRISENDTDLESFSANESLFARRDVTLGALGAATWLMSAIPAFADDAPAVTADSPAVGAPKPDPAKYKLKRNYPEDARSMVENMKVASEMKRGDPNMEETVKLTRLMMNNFVGEYRRQPRVAGMPSWSTLYTAINTLAGHYISYGNKYPVPEKRRTRLQQQYKEIERALKRGK